jgi:tetratricopeptide (TPR) repeat protein
VFHSSQAVLHNDAVWPPSWMYRKHVRILIPAAGAILLGGAGWLLGPLWAVAGIVAGPVVAVSIALTILALGKPDPVRVLQAGRAQQAHRLITQDLSFARKMARKRPWFRDLLAANLETMAQVLQALGNEPQALENATEAAAIDTELSVAHPDRYASALARTSAQQAGLLAQMGRHGEALAAIESAVQIYRRLALRDRGAGLPLLASALTRQSDELGCLGRITEARAAAAEAEMISTDMLPSAQSAAASQPPDTTAAGKPTD